MKAKHIFGVILVIYAFRVFYLLAFPIEITGEIVSDCFEDGCVVFEGDWIRLDGNEYKHEVFTDDIPLNPQIPYIEYTGKLTNIGNIYYLNEAHADTKLFVSVNKMGEVSLLSIPWFVLYSVSSYLPVYRHVQQVP